MESESEERKFNDPFTYKGEAFESQEVAIETIAARLTDRSVDELSVICKQRELDELLSKAALRAIRIIEHPVYKPPRDDVDVQLPDLDDAPCPFTYKGQTYESEQAAIETIAARLADDMCLDELRALQMQRMDLPGFDAIRSKATIRAIKMTQARIKAFAKGEWNLKVKGFEYTSVAAAQDAEKPVDELCTSYKEPDLKKRFAVLNQLKSIRKLNEVEQKLYVSLEKAVDIKTGAGAKRARDYAREQNAPALKLRVVQAAKNAGVHVHNWTEGWYFSSPHSALVRPAGVRRYRSSDFNAEFAPMMQQLADGKTNSHGEPKTPGEAFDYVRTYHGTPVVDGVIKSANDPDVVDFQGKKYVNVFDPESMPPVDKEYTWEGWADVLTVQHHVEINMGVDAAKINSWIAMNVQKPSKLIGFAPLIKGIQGDGKTILFYDMMSSLLGSSNVGMVPNDQIAGVNCGWAAGYLVVAFEEIKAPPGESRFAVTEKTKIFITNGTVGVVDKWVVFHLVKNCTNYVAMTNHPDALPLDDKDRRWMVIVMPWKSIAEFEAANGQYDRYFARLGDAIERSPGQLRKYYMEYELAEGFHWGMRAPDTAAKKAMIDVEENDNGLSLIRSYIEDGELGVSKEIISTLMLGEHLDRDGGRRERTRQVTRLMDGLGFIKVPDRIKWSVDGRKHTLYVSDPTIVQLPEALRKAKLRKLLESTNVLENKQSWKSEYRDKSGF